MESADSDNKDWPNLACGKQYMKDGKEWFQCTEHKHWVHKQCISTPIIILYICINGESDMEMCVFAGD